MTTSKEAIKAIRQALAHATPGPWVAGRTPFSGFASAYLDRVEVDVEGAKWRATICGYTETTDAVYIAACNPVNIAALLARLDELEQDARRYKYVVDCDFKAIKRHFKDVDEQTYKAKRRAKHDADMSKK